MASIQVLEIRPVEVQVEELSDNITGSIRGGDENAAILDCVGLFLNALDAGGNPLQAVGDFLACLALII